ncbi:MAG TPA: hypothetical protein PKD24_02520 [Pyrinomonadaceae bacterium]|nr:hypothetical protein [Pyrinomonadaceae bacterium]HMP63966.1 hypothetical protein [Pyrinomonadaceae bacterium]
MSGIHTKLAAVVRVLDDMRAKGIIGDYGVGGAVAATFHYQPISTVDLDIFFLFDPPQTGIILSLEPIYNYVRKQGFEYDKDFIFINGWPVQFIESSHDGLWKEAIEKSRTFGFGDLEIKVLPPEHLAAMWVQAGREKDIRKIVEFDEGGVMNRQVLQDLLERFGFLEKWRSIQGRLSNEYKF